MSQIPLEPEQQHVSFNQTIGGPPPSLLSRIISKIHEDPDSNAIRTTKYTPITFLPLNLFSQFRRFYNLYFLVGAIVAVVLPSASPIDPSFMLIPLAFVLTVTALKDLIEDYFRYLSDRKSNLKEYYMIRNGNPSEVVKSKDIRLGDIVIVKNNQEIPADLVLLGSSNADGDCFIQTAQLDGETALKRKHVLEGFDRALTEDHIQKISGEIACELPNELLYKFQGRATFSLDSPISTGINGSSYSLNIDHLLLRGAILKNTSQAWGIVVYTGKNTKIMKNLQQTSLKFSTLESRLNFLVLMIFILNLTFIIISAILSGHWQGEYGIKSWYIQWDISGGRAGTYQIITFFVLWSYLIPISLFVTIELCRLSQAVLIYWDADLQAEDGTHMSASNSNVNEDLGRIEFIFSDKTGTITRNEMKLSKWYVNGALLNELDFPEILKSTLNQAREKENILEFIRAIALCNEVVPEGGEYHSDSPDELALMEGLNQNGMSLSSRSKTHITIEISEPERYELIKVLEFSSDRKRMSVIVKTPSGEIVLYCKGADEVVAARLEKSQSMTMQHLQENVDSFSRQGLRTLVIAKRTLTEEAAASFLQLSHEASLSLTDREKKIEEAYNTIEQHLQVLGCTAVEDRLQDEAPETIAFLKNANISFWLLTGDKKDTAISIGIACNIFKKENDNFIVAGKTSDEVEASLRGHISRASGVSKDRALVIEGSSLTFALKEDLKKTFLEAALLCTTVICCRVSPLQKSLVVQLVQKECKKICLSVGDGANDVSMIEIADVGVGIIGKEGTQAQRASDYALVNFKSLKKLIAVHGRYCYLRLTELIFYSFYKNIAFIMVVFWFQLQSAWSGGANYDDAVLACFNLFFTSLPPLILGIFEKDIVESVALKQPLLYRTVQQGLYYNPKTILGWTLIGFWDALIIYYSIYFTYGLEETTDFGSLSMVFATMVIIIVNLKAALTTRYWTYLNVLAIFLSFLSFTIVLFGMVLFGFFYEDAAAHFLRDGKFYFSFLLASAGCLIPHLSVKYLQRQLFPVDWQILLEEYSLKKRANILGEDSLLDASKYAPAGYGSF